MSYIGLFHATGATQTELAEALGKSQGQVSRILNGKSAMQKETIDAFLAFLSKRLKRRVRYEELKGRAA